MNTPCSCAPRATIRKRLAVLSALLETAREDGQIRSNAAMRMRIGPTATRPKESRALTRRELRKLLKALPADWRLFFELLAHSGLRISEAVGLRWSDVDFGKRRLRIRSQVYKGERKQPKSRYGIRDIPLSMSMAQRLWDARTQSDYRADGHPVFASATGTPLRPANVFYRVLKPAARSVGLGWVGFHTFRHSCASLLFESGKNARQVQTWLGHADPGFTLRTYIHLLDAGVGDAEFMDAAVQGGNQVATRHPQTAENASVAERKKAAS